MNEKEYYASLKNVPDWAKPSTNDVVEEIRWWEAQNIPWQLVRELRRRSNIRNIGQFTNIDSSINFKNNHASYKGPITPWIRLFSNGTGRAANSTVPTSKYLYKNNSLPAYKGFLLEGGTGFNNAYGFKQSGDTLVKDKAILGYQADGSPHYIDPKYRSEYMYDVSPPCPVSERIYPQNSMVPPILPPPGIESVSIKTSKNMLAFATIKWKCFSLAQLEYLTPFFLSPGINVFLEFGWNLFDDECLVDYNDIDECYALIQRPELALDRYYRSFGNYGLITGIITNFSFSTEDSFVYNCTTELTSRQAMYAGHRTDNPVSVEETEKGKKTETTSEYLPIKDFFVSYLPFTKEIIKLKKNFMDFLISNPQEVSKILNLLKSNDSKAKQKIQDIVDTINNAPTKQDQKDQTSLIFYDGKKEDRIFMGRYDGIYKGYKNPREVKQSKKPIQVIDGGKETVNFNPNTALPGAAAAAELTRRLAEADRTPGTKITVNQNLTSTVSTPLTTEIKKTLNIPETKKYEAIEYGQYSGVNDSIKNLLRSSAYETRTVISDADDKTDFDSKESGDDEVWYQLDFIFELINLFCANEENKTNKIDISDIIISAHPNMISCDKNVLIPNPIAPKINIGTKYDSKTNTGGYLYADESQDVMDVNKNLFLTQISLTNLNDKIKSGLQEEEKLKEQAKNRDPECIKPVSKTPLWKAALKAKKTFKTLGSPRENLDMIINKLYYDIGQNPDGSAAFPFISETLSKINEEKYTPFYYGYLKHIYISKTKMIEMCKSSDIKTLEQLINKILNVINEAVGTFWNFEVVSNGVGGLTIIDKNLNLRRKTPIYMFDVGSNTNVIRKFSFDATISKEQITQILNGVGLNEKARILNEISKTENSLEEKKVKLTQIKESLPSIVFADRFDGFEVEKIRARTEQQTKVDFEEQNKQKSESSKKQNSTKGVSHGPMKDKNPEIQSLQKYGPQKNALTMRFRVLQEGENPIVKNDQIDEKYTWAYLTLPPELISKVRQMYDDDDTVNNVSKYAGPTDNFTINITFDGIMGFRMFQHIAVSNLPKPYVPGNIIFMINEVNHEISGGKWETTVTCMLRPANNQEFEFIPV